MPDSEPDTAAALRPPRARRAAGRRRARRAAGRALASATLALALGGALAAGAGAAQALSPLPASDYSEAGVCPPPAPGQAACMAARLVPQTAQARAHSHPLGFARASASGSYSPAEGGYGLRPQDLHSAYELPDDAAGAQTIALVDAYNDPTAEADLASYDAEFGLPSCTGANGCFEQVGEDGSGAELPFPRTSAERSSAESFCKGHEAGETALRKREREEACLLVREAREWSVEISLDVETAHAVCQDCRIALVEASSTAYSDLETAERTAGRTLGANEISNSWGGPECVEGECEGEASAFEQPGVVITASAGDDGYLNWLEEPRSAYANFPAVSPSVVAVGGTRLYLSSHGQWEEETVWNDGGRCAGKDVGHGAGVGGCSVRFEAPSWQRQLPGWGAVGCGDGRAVADVSADADPYTGVAVYDSSALAGECDEDGHWCTLGGTSLASPLIAATFALEGGAQGVEYPARTLYENAAASPSSLHDVSEGSNGECDEPFDEDPEAGIFETGCEPAEEAQASCSSDAICAAGEGYDGPTGVGTPHGLSAFASTRAGREASSGTASGGTGPSAGAATSAAPASPAAPAPQSSAPTATPAGLARVSALALTQRALIALDRSRPRVRAVSFSFTISSSARVRATLSRQRRRHGRAGWRALPGALSFEAQAGRNTRHLRAGATLGAGVYRLTVTPLHGAGRSITFRIG